MSATMAVEAVSLQIREYLIYYTANLTARDTTNPQIEYTYLHITVDFVRINKLLLILLLLCAYKKCIVQKS